jgi:hypothetical protein
MLIKNVSDKVAMVALEKTQAGGEVDRTGFALLPGEEKEAPRRIGWVCPVSDDLRLLVSVGS